MTARQLDLLRTIADPAKNWLAADDREAIRAILAEREQFLAWAGPWLDAYFEAGWSLVTMADAMTELKILHGTMIGGPECGG